MAKHGVADVDAMNPTKDGAFAVVQLKPGTETKLLRVLLENGYTNVSFTNGKGETMAFDEDADDEDESDVEIDVEAVKNDHEIDDEIKREIKSERRESTENVWPSKPPIDDESMAINKLEEAMKEHNKAKPFEFNSLTLPTVLLSDQPKFSYNPFLSLPFLPYLPRNDQHLVNALKANAPYFSPADLVSPPTWTAPSQTNVMDTPPSTPRGLSNQSNESNFLVNGAKLRQRGRQLRRHERESSSYASCRLCRNRILANRLSNLHNHVRRHAVLKQFHCFYCTYAHTEVAKVRLHMLHNHKDDHTQPLDKRNEDMEAAWSVLMKECFPGYV